MGKLINGEEYGELIHTYLFGTEIGLYKIGQTIHIDRRLNECNTASPLKVELIGYTLSDFGLEGRLHGLFYKKRVRLEWFQLNKDDIEFILSEFRKNDLSDAIARKAVKNLNVPYHGRSIS